VNDSKYSKVKWIFFVNFFSVVKLGDLQAPLQTFEKALELAKILEDEAAEKAISKTINDINDRIAQGKEKSTWEYRQTP